MQPEFELYMAPEDFQTLRDDWLAAVGREANKWADYHAVFSCNWHNEIWPCLTLGYHADCVRLPLPNRRVYKELARMVTSKRWNGGRFFVTGRGDGAQPNVVIRDADGDPTPVGVIRFCAVWDLKRLTFKRCDPVSTFGRPPSSSWAELL